MRLDNKKRAGKLRLLLMLIPLLILLSVGLVYLLTDEKSLLVIVYGALGLLVYFISMGLLQLNYINFYAGPDKVEVRFKNMNPVMSSNQSIKIKAPDFAGYEIRKHMGGLRKDLTLFQKAEGGVGKYPPVCVNALDAEELDKICKALDLVKMLNNKPD